MEELRRRAYLSAMQVASWLPRVELPFAAPSRPEVLEPPMPEVVPSAQPQEALVPNRVQAEPQPPHTHASVLPAANSRSHITALAQVRAQIEAPKTASSQRVAVPSDTPAEVQAPVVTARAEAPPRFTLQLMRAGACALLVELPNGEPLQGREPAYLLLKDLLRAAGLPDTPQPIGEPVRWPLLVRGQLDQGPQAALDFVHTFVATRLEQQAPCSCLWLLGLAALRFAGDVSDDYYNRELQVEGLGAAWAVPGLELLMDEPERKRELWHAMRRVRQRWMSLANE